MGPFLSRMLLDTPLRCYGAFPRPARIVGLFVATLNEENVA